MTAAFMNMNLGQTDGFGVPGREGDRDGKMREIFLSDGNSAILQSKDPYGHWSISWKDGRTPGDLIGQMFTSAYSAEQYLRSWLGRNRYNTTPVDTKVEIPEPQYKRVKKEDKVAA